MPGKSLSLRTRFNWLIDTAVFLGALIASVSGVYFLFLPSGGYRGGRNPFYGITILFDRHTWSDLHTWFGLAMIVAAVVHLAIHWAWVKTMLRRMVDAARARGSRMSPGAKFNLIVDVVLAASFLTSAISGLYFFFYPEGNGGRRLLDAATWDMLHTWSGVLLISAALVHLVIHWRWVTKVTGLFFKGLLRPVETRWAWVNNQKSNSQQERLSC